VDRLAAELAGSGLPHPLRVDAARAGVLAAVASGDPASAGDRARQAFVDSKHVDGKQA